MSPFAANSLIDAALRTTVPEDRVTDILAWCLAHNSDARRALCGVIGAPALDRSWVRTQRRVTAWDRIDCELRMTSDTDVHVVWIEVKIGRASEQPSQLQRYAEQLRSLYPGQSTLVALAPVNHDILQSALEPLVVGGVLTAEPKAIPLTWTELGRALHRTGCRRNAYADRRWRWRSRPDHGAAAQRGLRDVLDYLEQEGLVDSDEPITSSDAAVAWRAYSLLDIKRGAVAKLLDLAAARIDRLSGDDTSNWPGPFWHGRSAPWRDGWPANLEAGSVTAELFFAPNDEQDRREDEPRDEPVFCAAVYFAGCSPATLAVMTKPAWRPADVFVYSDGKKDVRATKLLYLSELAVRAVTLTEQAEELAAWANASFRGLNSLPDPRGLAGS